MIENFLTKLFEHNIWTNNKIIQVCATLSDEQLDAEPQSATQGSIRSTLLHLVSSQRGYLALLTQPVEARPTSPSVICRVAGIHTHQRRRVVDIRERRVCHAYENSPPNEGWILRGALGCDGSDH